jgi:hypothetical protein
LQPLRGIFKQLYGSGRLFPACLIGITIVIAASRAGLLSFLLVVQKKAEMILFSLNGSN